MRRPPCLLLLSNGAFLSFGFVYDVCMFQVRHIPSFPPPPAPDAQHTTAKCNTALNLYFAHTKSPTATQPRVTECSTKHPRNLKCVQPGVPTGSATPPVMIHPRPAHHHHHQYPCPMKYACFSRCAHCSNVHVPHSPTLPTVFGSLCIFVKRGSLCTRSVPGTGGPSYMSQSCGPPKKQDTALP